jgi:hypothetical protein
VRRPTERFGGEIWDARHSVKSAGQSFLKEISPEIVGRMRYVHMIGVRLLPIVPQRHTGLSDRLYNTRGAELGGLGLSAATETRVPV